MMRTLRTLFTLALAGCGSLTTPADKAPGDSQPAGPGTGAGTGAGTGTGVGTGTGGAATGAGTGTGATGVGTGTGAATGTGTGTTSQPARSCLEHLVANPGAASGVYNLEPTLGTTYSVYCDQVTDGGGWTLVGSSIDPLSDFAGAYHADLTTLDPNLLQKGIWSGLRANVLAAGGRTDIRMACTQALGGSLRVDLSFYDTDWYQVITTGTEDQSCFSVPAAPTSPPARRNNLTGDTLPVGDPWNSGNLVGEDACADNDDFSVDFDDRGVDGNETDGTDWGDDDGSSKCGAGGGIGFFLFIRE